LGDTLGGSHPISVYGSEVVGVMAVQEAAVLLMMTLMRMRTMIVVLQVMKLYVAVMVLVILYAMAVLVLVAWVVMTPPMRSGIS